MSYESDMHKEMPHKVQVTLPSQDTRKLIMDISMMVNQHLDDNDCVMWTDPGTFFQYSAILTMARRQFDEWLQHNARAHNQYNGGYVIHPLVTQNEDGSNAYHAVVRFVDADDAVLFKLTFAG